MTKGVITISRQYGSGGREIGRRLAEHLLIPFYDKEIIDLAVRESNIDGSFFQDADQKGLGAFSYAIDPGVLFDLPLSDKIYLAQRAAIQTLASQGPCVIVGRGACKTLGQGPLGQGGGVLRIFLYADFILRKQRVLDEYQEQAAGIEKRIRAVDARRRSYYTYYEDHREWWGEHFDLCIDTGKLGLAKTVDVILAAYS